MDGHSVNWIVHSEGDEEPGEDEIEDGGHTGDQSSCPGEVAVTPSTDRDHTWTFSTSFIECEIEILTPSLLQSAT